MESAAPDRGLLVKICGITSEADALLAVGLGADAVGFVFAPSPRQIAPVAVDDIVKRLPRGVLTVGVFRDEAPARLVEIANRIGLRAVQLHGHESPEQTEWVRQRVPCVIKAFAAGDPHIARFSDYGADYLLVDGPNPGSGSVFDWRLAEGVVDHSSMLVSGGLHAGNVGDVIARLRPRGVDVASGVELAPGHKDPQRLRSFIRAAREAQAREAQAREAQAREAQAHEARSPSELAGDAVAGNAFSDDALSAPALSAQAPSTDALSGEGGFFEGDGSPYDWMQG